MTQPPRLSVIVPAFNGGKKLRACLECLAASGFSGHELLLVDDGSTDGSIPEPAGRMRVLRHAANRGVAAARNTGAAAARAGILLFLDSDVLVPPGFLERVSNAFDDDPALRCLQAVCSALPANPGFTPELLTLMWRHGWLKGGSSATALNSYAFAIRTALFREAGGFDERFGTALGGEEIEFANRLSRIARLDVDPTLEVRHHFQHFRPRTASLFGRARRHGRFLLSARRVPTHGGGRPAEMALAALALLGAASLPLSLPLAAASFLLYPLLRLPLLSFVAAHRGIRFALLGIPALWTWSLAAGAGGALGIADGILDRLRTADG